MICLAAARRAPSLLLAAFLLASLQLAALLLAPPVRAQATEAIYVAGIQRELLAHGYQPGPIDGIAGARTREAIRAYQRDAGLAVDGKADRRLLDHLKFALPKVYAFGEPVIGHVLDVQRALAERGYYLGPHDGVAGSATHRAVDRFRRDAGLPADTSIDAHLLQRIRDAPPEVMAQPAH